MAAEVNAMYTEPQCKPSIQSRFSTLRYMKVVKKFNPIQRSFISNHDLDNLLKLPDHLMVPLNLLQWLAGHTSHGEEKFLQHKEKIIHFTKDIVDKVFGFPSGSKPFVMESTDPEIVREVEAMQVNYLLGKKQITVANVESVLLGSNEEIVFIRSFILFFITTVLCPSTYNFVNPKYLYSLRDSDIAEVENLDLGTLCLNHLWNEVDAWKAKVFKDGSDFNRMLWIGGCLPLLAVVYMDFLDLGANGALIDYSIPRMAHIKNEHFMHVHNADRNLLSRKSYGVLPLRDISLTPYSAGLAIVPVVAHIHPFAHASPNEVLDDNVVEDNFMEDIGNHQETIDISDSHVESFSIGCYTMEPEGKPRSPDADDDFVESKPANPVETMEGGSRVGDALWNIAISYAEISDSYSVEEIVEGFVSNQENPMEFNGHDGSPVTNTGGTDAGNNGLIVLSGSCDRKLLEKRNRKKRAAIATTPEKIMPKFIMDDYIENFHTQHLRKNRFKQSYNDIVVEIGRYSVTYKNFVNSFKDGGHVNGDTMSVYAQIYNDQASHDALSKPFLKKYMFATVFSEMLMKDPTEFDKHSVRLEFNWIMNYLGFDLSSMDILHFPSVWSNNWVLIAVNPLYETIDFFDATSLTSEEDKLKLMTNLAFNLNTVSKELNIFAKDISKFKKPKTPSYTTVEKRNDDGICTMIYAENWTGKFMRYFTKEIIPDFRKLKGYDMFYCIQNKVAVQQFEKRRKRKV